MTKPGDNFRNITGSEIPETIQEIDKFIEGQRRLKEPPIARHGPKLVHAPTIFFQSQAWQGC